MDKFQGYDVNGRNIKLIDETPTRDSRSRSRSPKSRSRSPRKSASRSLSRSPRRNDSRSLTPVRRSKSVSRSRSASPEN